MTNVQRRLKTIWQYCLLFLRPRLREPGEIFWAFGFPVMITVIMALAFDSDSKPVEVSRIGYWPEKLGNTTAILLKVPLEESGLTMVLLPSEALGTWETTREKHLTKKVTNESMEFPKELMPFHLDGILTGDTFVSLRGSSGKEDVAFDRLSLKTLRAKVTENPLNLEKFSLRGGRFMDWFIPGILGLQAFSWGLWVAQILAEYRNKGFLQRMRLAPFRFVDFLAGISLGSFFWGGMQFCLLLGVFVFYPGVTPVGSYVNVMLLLFLISLASFFAVTMFTSRAFSQPVVLGISNALFFPSMFMSGVYFKVENFPEPIQTLINLLPLGAGNKLLRLFYEQGVGWMHPEAVVLLAVLLAWTIVCGAVTLKTYSLSQVN